jgi:hypothetical protein
MGWTYVVKVWDCPDDGPCNWLEIYGGQSIINAVYKMWWAKRNGWLCIKLEWRP